MVPDEAALASLRPLLYRLSRERHEVTMLVDGDAPSEAARASFEKYWGLTIAATPRTDGEVNPSARSGDGASTFERKQGLDLDAIGQFEERKPQVLVVIPDRTPRTFERDYLQAANAVGIRSVCLPVRWDDIRNSPGLQYELPDVFAVWNDDQRRDAMARFSLPGDRVIMTGAILSADVVEDHGPAGRDAYCEHMGIAPERPIVLIDAPTAPSAEWIARLGDWRRGLKGAANPQTADAAVVVWVNNHDDVATWRKFAQTTDIVIARPGTSQERAGFRLAESIAAADVVVATGLPFMLEAVSRVKPTIAMMGAGGTDAADLEAFVNKYPSMRDRVTVTETAVGGAAQIVIALSKRPSAHTNRGNAAAVQKRVDDNGSERVYRLLEQLARQDYKTDVVLHPPKWQRLSNLLSEAAANRTSP